MSNTIRVYELSKETGLSNKEILRRLTELGIEATSHSSSISEPEARRFRESLGRKAPEEEEAERRRQEEAERLAKIDLDAVKEQQGKKARKVLPPHLRAQEEAEEVEEVTEVTEPAAEQAEPVEPDEAVEPAAEVAEEPAAQTPVDTGTEVREEQPAAETQQPAAAAGGTRMPGAPPPPSTGDKAGPTPARARMPGAPPPPTVTGESPEARRKVEPNLPQEGSGRRSIPKPIRAAPQRTERPSGPAKRSDSSPYRQPVGKGGPSQGGGGTSGGPPSGGAPNRGGPAPTGKTRRKKRERTPEEQALEQRPQIKRDPLDTDVERVDVLSGITVAELSDKVKVPSNALVKKLFEMGEMATVQQSLPDDTVEILCAELGVDVYFMSEEEVEFGIEDPDSPEELEPRPPVVTVLGHVDHGKTALLDAIRETDVVSGEAGGITQHIGAYQINKDGRRVTFIDTPGHEAFTAMRARGAQVTDIAVLVVAADDGVMPQTVEAINHAKAAEVPIVVAVNKMDLPEADPDKVKGQLTEYELVAEDYGGETPIVPLSAMTHDGIEDLLEILLLQADIMELQANPNKDARGRVIEAHLDKGRGAVATVLVQAGTLRVGDVLVAGVADGKVRAMFDEHGDQVDEAVPSQPVLVLGWNDVPEAGDEFRVTDEERAARDIAERRAARARRKELVDQQRPKTLEDLAAEVERGEIVTLNVIIKGDVSGSVEALEDALTKLEIDEVDGTVEVRVVHKGVGAVTANDVRLAEASDAMIVAFNVRPDANARAAIDESGVDLRTYSIIYEAIEDIERRLMGLLGPEIHTVELGQAEVREIFKVPRVGFVFGSYVTEGDIKRDAQVRVVREGVVVAEDIVASLKRFQDDVREVSSGYECGIGLRNFQDVKVGDVFEVFEQREVARV
ncbi:MAG: translation initiation factor IF-2 [Actinobacteria bacterium]|nr:translation initiation factor IF-2 [Actinomycetota bacterium]